MHPINSQNSLLRKPRADSALKSLSEERQAKIFDYMRGHTRRETAEWLARDGIELTLMVLTRFWRWYSAQRLLRENCSTVARLLAEMRKSDAELTASQLEVIGQVFFTALAIKQKDSLSWKRAADVRVKHKGLALQERRVKILENQGKAEKSDAPTAATPLTPEQKEAEYKRILGLDE
jgi:hypothetical protein